jgi:2-phosphoglycerate kinase
VDWLPYIGRWRWILVTKDWNIQANPTERNAIINAGVRAFVVRAQRLSRNVIIELLNFAMPRMMANIARYKVPFIFSVEADGELKALSTLEERSR